MQNKRHGRGWLLVLMDIVLVGVVLVVFALFHHVLPRKGTAISTIVAAATPTPTVQTEMETDGTASATVAEAASETVLLAPGDFSDRFSQEDTGADALYSYQNDDLRIAVTKVQENDITYYVADVWVRNISTFRTAFAEGQYGTGIHDDPINTANANNAILAVTGDYYGARTNGIVIRNGELYRDSLYKDVCVLYYDGSMETYAKEDFDIEAAIDKQAWQAWSFGPMLLEDGQLVDDFSGSISGKNPRCGIGYYEPGHYCLVTVDGRQKDSDGMSLAEFSQVFYSLGCKTAYNMDGGATAAMIFQGEVINSPANGGRESSDIICFSEGN